MHKIIKAIPTRWNGIDYRSKLEAQWAVFFNQGEIKNYYETEGFEDDEGHRYQPDFYLPEYDLWAEVKGHRPTAWEEIQKSINLMSPEGPIKRLLILSDFPLSDNKGLPHFPYLYFVDVDGEGPKLKAGWFYFYQGCSSIYGKRVSEGSYYNSPFSLNFAYMKKDTFDCQMDIQLQKRKASLELSYAQCLDGNFAKEQNPMLFKAYDFARNARFDHGQSPAVKGE